MLSEKARKLLEKQHYKIIGNHSAVKICNWTKKSIKGEEPCYKFKFYGINSHQCLQMTTNLSCANRCLFCWRDYKAPVSKKWEWQSDDPEFILKNSIKAHLDLLSGLGGYKNINKNKLKESKTIKHTALSLIGEPITYPKINELINILHKNKISTFIVTNAQYPEAIKNLNPITQLYISLDAPTKDLLKKIDLPLFSEYWERLNKSLYYMSKVKQRTCIRLTMIKGINTSNFKEYSTLIKKANPDFIEVKAYMFIGASRKRLQKNNMPYHEDIVVYSKELLKYLPNYEIVSEHIASRVTLLAKKEFKKNNKWHTWIDFNKFFSLVNSGKEFTTQDYLKETPTKTGLSGKGTKDRKDPKFRHKIQIY
jgi:tRNA wybutosine-synthesizing protein 1